MAVDPAQRVFQYRGTPRRPGQGSGRMTPRHDALLAGLDDATIQALVEGRNGDPFSILGPHPSGKGSITRAFLPGATAVEVLTRETGRHLATLERVHPGGLFAGYLDQPSPYKLRIVWPDAIQETEDPYSFGLLLGDLDLHLIGQGTHYKLSHVLGAVATTIDGVPGVRFAVWAPN